MSLDFNGTYVGWSFAIILAFVGIAMFLGWLWDVLREANEVEKDNE